MMSEDSYGRCPNPVTLQTQYGAVVKNTVLKTDSSTLPLDCDILDKMTL